MHAAGNRNKTTFRTQNESGLTACPGTARSFRSRRRKARVPVDIFQVCVAASRRGWGAGEMKPGGENEQGNEAQDAQLLGAGWGPCPPWHGDSPAPRGVPNPQHPATGGPWGKPESPAPFGDADPSKHPAPSPFWARLQVGPPQDVPPKGSSATQAPATRCGAQLAPANPPGWAVGDGSQQAWDRLWGGTGGARTLWGRGVPPGGPGVQLAGGGSGRGGGPRGPLQVTQRHGAPMELSAGTPGGFTNPMCRCWGTAPTLKLLLDHFPDVSNAGTPATAGPGLC